MDNKILKRLMEEVEHKLDELLQAQTHNHNEVKNYKTKIKN
ncbi:Transcriptional regulator [Rickettsia prowazekii str. GvF12]|nr:Transcriptional regulator [Rickettsia prowazekii str. GvF12]